MKKRILALVCASAMVVGMSLSVSAAGSVTSEELGKAEAAIKEAEAPAEATMKVEENKIVVEVKDSAVKVEVPLSAGAREESAKAAEAAVAEKPATATITALPESAIPAVAKIAAAAAKVAVAEKAAKVETKFVADIANTPGETATFKFNIKVESNQTAYALHYKADGSVEQIKCDVAGDAISFKLTSYSPVAIVVVTEKDDDAEETTEDTTTTSATVVAPKTGDVSTLMAILAAVSATGVAVLGKKRK